LAVLSGDITLPEGKRHVKNYFQEFSFFLVREFTFAYKVSKVMLRPSYFIDQKL
jgi:hypothetical protein